MHWTQCIKDLSGRRVTLAPRPINKFTGEVSAIDTGGKEGVISKFDRVAGKYEISFANGWCGWYTFKELILGD